MDAAYDQPAEIVDLFPGARGLVVVSAAWRGTVFYEPSWYLFPDRVRVDNAVDLPGVSVPEQARTA